MVRKPGRMYTQVKGKAYTRREYMGGVPGSRITQFDMGNRTGTFNSSIDLMAEEGCQIRHTALEAARITATRYLGKAVGTASFYLKIRVYPHHVIRENKMATGAGADRVSEGMRKAFGKAVGTAARVKPGQKLITVYIDESSLEKGKIALKKAGMKLPTPFRLIEHRGE